MARQTINIGTSPNDGTGDALRSAFNKINENFLEVYDDGGANITVNNPVTSTETTLDTALDDLNSGINPTLQNVSDNGGLNNGSTLSEGTVDNGFGGGISLICVADKEQQWENGVRYLRAVGGTNVYAETLDDITPDVTYDETKNWAVGSYFKNLVQNKLYKCTDASTGSAVWELQSAGAQDLQQVLTEGMTAEFTTDLTDNFSLTYKSSDTPSTGTRCSFSIQEIDASFDAIDYTNDRRIFLSSIKKFFSLFNIANSKRTSLEVEEPTATGEVIYKFKAKGSAGTYNVATEDQIPSPITIDANPTDGSSNAVSSNGVFDALATKQDTLTDVNFGAFANGLTAKTTPLDADLVNIVDTADSNKQKKVTWTNVKAFLKTYFDAIYTTTSAVASQISSAISGKEDSSNKVTTFTGNEASTTKFPVVKAILDYFTASQIRSILGISTLSGSNTGDQDLSGLMVKSNNGSDIANIATFRANLGVDKIRSIGNTADSILATDKAVVTSATLTASRTWTLPLANAVNAGYEIIVADLFGGVTSTNTLVIARAGSDTINGATSVTIGAQYGMRRLISDGVSKWTFDGGVMRISDYIGTTLTASKVVITDGNSKLSPSSVNTTELGYLSNLSAWTSYGGTSTITGFSSVTTSTINYIQIGKLVFVQYEISGTSNAQTFTFTIPFTTVASNQSGYAQGVNNTSNNAGVLSYVDASTSTVKLLFNSASPSSVTTWTSSGTKSSRGIIILNVI